MRRIYGWYNVNKRPRGAAFSTLVMVDIHFYNKLYTFTIIQVAVQHKTRRTSTLVAFQTGGAQQTNMATVVTQTII